MIISAIHITPIVFKPIDFCGTIQDPKILTVKEEIIQRHNIQTNLLQQIKDKQEETKKKEEKDKEEKDNKKLNLIV